MYFCIIAKMAISLNKLESMEVSTDNKHLKVLYQEGKSKKLKLPNAVVKKFYCGRK